MSAQESLALIERQHQEAHRRLGVNVALFYGPWGAAYLLGLGSVFLTYPSALPIRLPGVVAGVTIGVLFAAAVVVSVVTGTRARRGLRGPSWAAGAMYGWSWTLGFCAPTVVNVGVTRQGLSDDAVTLLWSGSSLLLVGVLYLAGCSPRRPTNQEDEMEINARAVQATRRYGPVTALDAVTLDVPAGQLLGLLGPNGAGKTTLLQLLAGLRRPTSGTVELFGGDPRDAARRRRLGCTPQETGLPPTLRVHEVVDFVAGHFDDPVPTAELLEQFGLTGLERRQTGGLSGGQKRRLVVAIAFVGRPDLVLLDEPTTGLDVEARHALWGAIRAYHEGGATVVLTSHYLEEVEALAERIVVVDQGRVRIDGTLADVRALVPARRVRLRATELPELAGVERSSRDGDRYELWTADSDALVRALVSAAVPFRDLEVSAATLEEAFLALTSPGNQAMAPTDREMAR